MEWTNEDYITIGVSVVTILAGVYILGRREADGAWGLGLWDARVFAAFLTFTGIGIIAMWFANLGGNPIGIDARAFEDQPELLEAVGFIAGLSFTVAAVSASVFDKDAPLPGWAKNLVALLGLGILFASGLTITVQSFYNADFAGDFLGITMPLFPMNEFIASIWTAGLLSLCGAALLGLVANVRETVE